MAVSFFFYDLETSGIDSRKSRVMQFAGQRTDIELRPVGEPVNLLIKLTDDILPEVDATLITGITPQSTMADGLTEAEFLHEFTNNVATPGTVFTGFNTVRFDDEFMRCMHYRNFYDPYEWQWQDNRSKWDLLDVVRMTRALRPGDIKWPFDINGKATNRLELLTGMNALSHEHAHDALSDVNATIEVARMIYNKQAKLFEYLFSMRDKKKVIDLVSGGQPFVYTSGRYSGDFDKTTIAVELVNHPKKQGVLVYDLRHDPANWVNKTVQELAEAWRWKKDNTDPRLPVKTLQFNRCPAVAPVGVLDQSSQERLKIDLKLIQKHNASLKQSKDFSEKLLKALEILDTQFQTSLVSDAKDVDSCIYDGFFPASDKQAMRVVRAADPSELGDLGLKFEDHRLEALLPLYKARNYPKQLTGEERAEWEKFRVQKLMSGGQHSIMAKYFARLQEVATRGNLTGHQQYLLEELKLYAESVMPEVD